MRNVKRRKIFLNNNARKSCTLRNAKLEQMASLGPSTDKATKTEQAKVCNVKIPKLVITKYDGTYERWLSFWNNFEAEIDSVDLPAATKFSYLRELLQPHVCDEIDGLPFTTEGYTVLKIS